MMHFFRRSKIHLDCFTNNVSAIEYAPIDHAIKHIPEWWRALPKEIYANNIPSPTMKTCVGMYDFYAKSICLPLWSELTITTKNNEYSWQFSDCVTEGIVHNKHQYAGFGDGTGQLKLESPWLFETKDTVHWAVSQPTYSNKKVFDYVVLPGVLEFKHQNATNVQTLINLRENKTFCIPHNTPLALFTPMSDKKVVIHRHLVGWEMFKKLKTKRATPTFINSYKTQQQKIKCPYKDHIK
jgi:hypothetical protein